MESDELKKLYNDCTDMIMCTTLNQVVNYLPLIKITDIKKECSGNSDDIRLPRVYSIGYEQKNCRILYDEDGKFPQNRWFKNLTNELENYGDKLGVYWGEGLFKHIKITRNQEEIKSNINECDELNLNAEEKNDQQRIFIWNLTGGQRMLVFEIIELLRELKNKNQQHYIIYLEGNSGRITLGTVKDGNITYSDGGSYRKENLPLETVFGLSGFEAPNVEKQKNINLLSGTYSSEFSDFFDKDEEAVLNKILGNLDIDNYISDLLVKNNTEDISNKNKSRRDVLIEGLAKKNGRDLISGAEVLAKRLKNNNSPAGYLLEYLALIAIREVTAKLNRELKEQIFCGLYHNVGTYHTDKGKSEKQFCEFDIVLLTSFGQVIIFECKSGGMTGENSKSRQYATYSIGGVFGMPILITPLRHCNNNGSYKENDNEKDRYSNVNSAINSARRCNMNVIGINVLKEALMEIFSEMDLLTGGKNEQG